MCTRSIVPWHRRPGQPCNSGAVSSVAESRLTGMTAEPTDAVAAAVRMAAAAAPTAARHAGVTGAPDELHEPAPDNMPERAPDSMHEPAPDNTADPAPPGSPRRRQEPEELLVGLN